MKNIQYFKKHTDYNNYINSIESIKPNLSYCEDSEHIHFNKDPRLVIQYNVVTPYALQDTIYIDDFPESICERDFDGDMEAFKEYALEHLESCNEYVYTGETYEYNGQDYYLWEIVPKD